MPNAIQRRRGTTAEHASFTGLQGELTVDTTKKAVVVHDGATAGGFPMALEKATLPKTSTTGSAAIPGGTTAERDAAPQRGYQRHNATPDRMEWFNGTAWVGLGAGLAASEVTNTPAGGITEADVQGALNGLDTRKAPKNYDWSAYGGTANAVTLTPNFARTAYARGDVFRFRATATNTGATTIKVGALAALTALTVTGAALPAGYIRTDADTVCVYDGTNVIVSREVERGSNANGEYIRYAHGEQRCWFSSPLTARSLTSAFGSMFILSAPASRTFPVAFSTAPVVSHGITGFTGSTRIVSTGTSASTAATNFDLLSVVSITNTVADTYKAVGYWY